MSENTSIAAEI